MEIKNNASDKFRDRQDEICGMLFGLLREINSLENGIYERCKESGSDERALLSEYKARLDGIVRPFCTDKLLKKGWGGAFNKPPKHDYIDGDCTAEFIMKSAKMATVITHYKNNLKIKSRFVIRDVDGKWLVDEVYYATARDPDKWYTESMSDLPNSFLDAENNAAMHEIPEKKPLIDLNITNEAAEKFRNKQDEVVSALVELLRLLDDLERSAYKQSCEISIRLRNNEITKAEYNTAMKDFWDDYREECRKIVEPRCTEKLVNKGYAGSYSSVSRFGYIEGSAKECRGTFSMTSAKRAAVELRFTNRISQKLMHRFTLVRSDGKWLTDSFSFKYETEESWHRIHF